MHIFEVTKLHFCQGLKQIKIKSHKTVVQLSTGILMTKIEVEKCSQLILYLHYVCMIPKFSPM